MDISNSLYETTTPWMTFFTSTYNRVGTLPRCYECLKRMRKPVDSQGKALDFEWVIIDDGSEDNTRELVQHWVEENLLPIRFLSGPNRGKHVEYNRAVQLARGEMFTDLDSDDTYVPETLEVFYKEWMAIPADRRADFRGVAARCKHPETGEVIGSPLPRKPYYCYTPELRFKDKVTGDLCGCVRTDLLRQYPFPEFEEKLSYCPESIVWLEMGSKYLETIVDVPLKLYYFDTNNSITGGRSSNRSKALYYLWQYELNNLVLKYLFHSPKEMMKAVVGISMDGLRTGRSPRRILRDVTPRRCKLLVALFMPAGWLLSKRK